MVQRDVEDEFPQILLEFKHPLSRFRVMVAQHRAERGVPMLGQVSFVERGGGAAVELLAPRRGNGVVNAFAQF
ncbi:hypothetical protein SDC9_153086 [bioreactor metagenome]|uniref:Uncharacterized protein n=1 Tax=bioreactor metagenome TaxID=1076179 RepID=A0A645EX71_9ZZZZ